eukprot:gene10467-8427_t
MFNILYLSVGRQPRPTRLLATNNLYCDVWQLARASTGEGQPEEGDPLDLVAGPRQLVRIKLSGRISCSAISPDGQYVCCSGPEFGVRLYRLESEPTTEEDEEKEKEDEGKVTVARVPLPSPALGVASALVITPSGFLLASLPCGSIKCFQLPTAEEEKVVAAVPGLSEPCVPSA